jgi:hypothetical protein
MTAGVYNPYAKQGICPTLPAGACKDYTFTGTIHPMKLVFFDLNRRTSLLDSSVYSNPMAFTGVYYANKIMNYYGDSFHVTLPSWKRPGYSYTWSYGTIDTVNPLIQVVDKTERKNLELGITYPLRQINLGTFTTPSCQQSQIVLPTPKGVTDAAWPQDCTQIDGAHILAATQTGGPVGFMLLNGKRLGNLGAIEAIPNAAIADPNTGFRAKQIKALGGDAAAAAMAGQILWNVGTRAGIDTRPRGPDNKLACTTGSLATCWIGRFGWLGDRVSLEDQVANAAFVEMGLTSRTAFNTLYPNGTKTFPIRYNFPNCGQADQICLTSKNAQGTTGNGDLFEEDIDRMADYARWLGSPTRSEFTVSLPEVIAGEKIFRSLQCNNCHVIGKIAIPDPNDTMLPTFFQQRKAFAPPASPFLSYLGTDLLMHDMGYLSQVAYSSTLTIRDPNTGVVLPAYSDYVQKVRTPPLKGLRFNRFVTDSHRNTLATTPPSPACDFLLHDGRACDAIEAAFLHDGPEVKKLGVISGLSVLMGPQLKQLRAFLYSL